VGHTETAATSKTLLVASNTFQICLTGRGSGVRFNISREYKEQVRQVFVVYLPNGSFFKFRWLDEYANC